MIVLLIEFTSMIEALRCAIPVYYQVDLFLVIEAWKSSLTVYTLYWRPFTHNIRSWWYTQIQLYTGDHNLHPLLATPTFSVLPQPFLFATLKHGNGLGRGRVYSACTSRVIIIVIEHIRSCQKCTALPTVMLCIEAKHNQYTAGEWLWLPKTFMLIQLLLLLAVT